MLGEQQAAERHVVVAGDNGKLFHLRIFLQQNLAGELGILHGGLRPVLHQNAALIHTVFHEPCGHLIRLRQLRLAQSGAAAGDGDKGVGILLGAGESGFAPADQLLGHAPVRIELIAQHHDAETVILGRPVRQKVVIDLQVGVDEIPVVHHFTPGLAQGRVNFLQVGDHSLDLQIGGRAVLFIGVHDVTENVIGL